MTSGSEYNLLHDKNIKGRGALVSTWKFNSPRQVWIMKLFKETNVTSFPHCLHPFKIGHGVISISVYDVESI